MKLILSCLATISLSCSALAQLSGTYTINAALPTSGTNYANFSDVAADLNSNGVSGPVEINVVTGSGPYIGQVTINEISGVSATNTITINGNGNTLNFSGTATNHAGIQFNGTDYFHIKNLTINGNGDRAWCILFRNGADYNSIENCNLLTEIQNLAPGVSGGRCGVVFSSTITSPNGSGNNGSYNLIANNTISGGERGGKYIQRYRNTQPWQQHHWEYNSKQLFFCDNFSEYFQPVHK